MTVSPRVAETRALKRVFNMSSELPGKCSALEKVTRCRTKFIQHMFPCLDSASTPFLEPSPLAFWHFLSCSLDSSGSPPHPSSLSLGAGIFIPMSQKGNQGPWGQACSWRAVEPFLALVHTALPFLVLLMEKRSCCTREGLREGVSGSGEPHLG